MQRLLEPVAQEHLRLLKQDKILYQQWLNQPVTQEVIKVLEKNRECLRQRLEDIIDYELHDLALKSSINSQLIEDFLDLKPEIETNHPYIKQEH